MRILIVEDEKKLNDILQRSLKSEGYTVDGVGTAADGLEYVKTYHYDLIILDIQLPDGTGTGLFQEGYASWSHTMPALVLTACGDLTARWRICRWGPMIMSSSPWRWPNRSSASRFRCVLRGPALQENVLKAGTLEINRLTRQVKRDGKRIELSPKEYSLLEYLFLHSGRVLSRSMIVEKIWDQSFEGLTNIVDVYIGHLRRKIDEGHEPKFIRTVRGLGYTFDTDQSK